MQSRQGRGGRREVPVISTYDNMTATAKIRLSNLASSLPGKISKAFETGDTNLIRSVLGQMSALIEDAGEHPESDGLAMIADARKQLKKLAGV